MTEIVDGTAEDITPADEQHEVAQAASTAVARRERRSEVIRPLNADALVESFAEYQDLLPKLLDASDYQKAGFDKKTGKERKFVKKSGWRKIATAFDLDVQLLRSTVERDDHGQPVRAEVWARAIAPSGRSMDGDGYCAIDEERFSRDGGKAKVENDLRATATTRAMNRAISGLVGMGDVSAEEVDTAPTPTGPPFGPEATQEELQGLSLLLTALCDGDVEKARERWGTIKTATAGYMPSVVARGLMLAVGDRPEPATPEPS